MVALKNANKRRPAGPYSLPHKQYCSDGECRCTSVERRSEVYNRETGAWGYADQRRAICASLLLLAGEMKSGLPDTIRLVPDVAAAIARGELIDLNA